MSSERYALLIGNANFSPSEKSLPPLRCPPNDVAGLAALLTSEEHGPFRVTCLVDETHEAVLKAIYNVLANLAGKEDTVVIYYSGHGKPNTRGDLHLVTRDTTTTYLPVTSVPIDTVSRWMQDSHAAQIVLILDCCYSGAFNMALTRGEAADQLAITIPKQLSGRGTYILTASTEVELAEEKEGDSYGLLTKHIINGIRDGTADLNDDGFVSMNELTVFVQEQVAKERARQTPQGYALRAEGGELKLFSTGRAPGKARISEVSRLVFEMAAKGHIPFWVTRAVLDAIGDDNSAATVPADRKMQYVDRLFQSRNDLDAFFVTMQDIAHQEGIGISRPDIGTEKVHEKQGEHVSDDDVDRMLGQKCYHAGDYDSALFYFKRAADAGNAESMLYLGIMYAGGEGVPKNDYVAREWYLKAAQAGEYGAMLNLGAVAIRLNDYQQAVHWFEKAADRGDYDAMVNLGTLLRDGRGVGQDYSAARAWFEKAAVLGNNAIAMSRLGDLYRDGLGGSSSRSEARKWYERAIALGKTDVVSKLNDLSNVDSAGQPVLRSVFESTLEAAKAGDPEAIGRLADMYMSGNGTQRSEFEGLRWYKRAVEIENVDAMTKLGILYFTGEGVPTDFAKSRHLLERASGLGGLHATTALGVLLASGLVSTQNETDKAIALLESSSERGDESAMQKLGEIYEGGTGTQVDYTKARSWYSAGAMKGSTNSMVNLGVLLCKGQGGPRDYQAALKWFLQAANAGDADAMVNAAFIFEDGLGVAADKHEARLWFKRAADLGNVVATDRLKEANSR